MTDLSSALDDILKKHNTQIARHRKSISDITDEFLKDAYQIRSHISSLHLHLKSIRGPYLSTTSTPSRAKRASLHQAQNQQRILTTAERDALDAEAKGTLRDLSAAIGRLDQTEKQRREIRRQLIVQRSAKRFPLGALGRWAAGDAAAQKPVLTPEEQDEEDREKTTDAWREGVLWFLRQKLGSSAEVQRQMMEKRIQREMEKNTSMMFKARGTPGAEVISSIAGDRTEFKSNGLDNGDMTSGKTAMAEDKQGTGSAVDYQLTPEQLQLFAEENNAMLRHYEDALDQVRVAERSMVEISELQTTLAENLSIQAERIDSMVEDSQRTEENVTGGNKQLKQATERWRPAKMMFWATCSLSGFLIFWDLIF